MKRGLKLIMLLFILATSTSGDDLIDALTTSLVEAERAFAAASANKGMKAAFLTFLAEEAVLFRPGPVNGRKVWQKANESTARLEWWPTIAFVASSGELGYTSGPWIYTPEAELDQPPRHGYFVSVWKKEKGGRWKVVLDLGTPNDAPAEMDTVLVTPRQTETTFNRLDWKSERKAVLNVEKKFSARSSSGDAIEAMNEHLTDDGRVYRPGFLPLVGRERVLAALRESGAAVISSVKFIALSKGCDLAYTYGTYRDHGKKADSGYFVRIWRKNDTGDWKLAVDIISPEARQQ